MRVHLSIYVTALLTLPAVVFPIASNAQPALPLRALVEELRIDGRNHEWKTIEKVRMGPAGHILVKEQLGRSLYVFSPTGALVRTIGQRGQGPGEFTNIDGFGARGDTIWVSDGVQTRITYFNLSGIVLGTFRADSGVAFVAFSPDAPRAARLNSRGAVALYNDGTALVMPTMFPGETDTLGASRVYPFWRTTRAGRVIDTVLAVTLESELVRITSADGARRNFMPNPFPPRQVGAASANGLRLALIDAAFNGPDAWTYSVRLADERGRTIYTRRFPFTRVPVPSRVVDSIGTSLATRYRNYARIREALPVPPSYPPMTKALVADDGSLWLRGRDNVAGAMWTILDSRGNPIASVREPARTRFIELQGGIWAVERDADDVESIVRYRLGSP